MLQARKEDRKIRWVALDRKKESREIRRVTSPCHVVSRRCYSFPSDNIRLASL
jgi:hypothetical protein